MSLIRISWRGVDGSLWEFGTSEDSAGVILGQVSGLTGKVGRATVGKSTGVGVRVNARTLPEITGGLDLLFTRDRGRGMELVEVHRAFFDAWSEWVTGGLEVTDSRGATWSLPCVLGDLGPANPSPATPGLRRLERSWPLWSPDGAWSGRPIVVTGSGVIGNRGSIPLHPRVRWVGVGRSVTLPGGVVVALPPVATPHYISTDPGEGYVVTDELGNVDPDVWALLRGRPVYGRIEPGESSTWSMTAGVEVHAVERITNPWR